MQARIASRNAAALAALIALGLGTARAEPPSESSLYSDVHAAREAKSPEGIEETTTAYLAHFADGPHAAEVKQILGELYAARFNDAIKAKAPAQMIKVGDAALGLNPENLDYLYNLAVVLRRLELGATPPNYEHADKLADYTLRASKLIEAGQVPSALKNGQFNQGQELGRMYHTLALLDSRAQNQDRALENLAKSIALDPESAAPFYLCGKLRVERYKAANDKYKALPQEQKDANPAPPELTQVLDTLRAEADAAIKCYVPYLKLTANKPSDTRSRVEATVEALWSFRNPTDPDGWRTLVGAQGTAAPTPAASAPPRGEQQTH